MPLHYGSIVTEHLSVRRSVGLFDLSHMGQLEVCGEEAGKLLQNLCTNDISRLKDGQALYTLICQESGGIVDDVIVYRFTNMRYMVVVNAANIEKDRAWLETHNTTGAALTDLSEKIVLIALQGPGAIETLNTLVPHGDVPALPFFGFTRVTVAGISTLISRTGYTGEVGFELYVDVHDGEKFWNILYPAVEAAGGAPIGLGARNTLRLEAGLRLYGMDINERTTPLEAGLARFVKLDKGEFIGRNALLMQRKSGIRRCLIGFQMLGRKMIARTGYDVFREGLHIGTVTSGAPAPSLRCNIGFAYIDLDGKHSPTNLNIDIQIRGKRYPAKIVKVPFYSR